MPQNTSFSALNLPEYILAAITEMGFSTPTPIQEQAIPALSAHRDVVGVAQTGTGKTAAFALPMLAQLNPADRFVQALVLTPTRELALQGADAIAAFSAEIAEINVVSVYGGSAYGPQLNALERGAQVVVGTPGRIMDLIGRGALDLSRVHYFVLDEADEMLRMGFAEDVETIAKCLPEQRVSALFSATMPPAIRRVADTYLNDPVEITVTPPSSTVDTIAQSYAVVPARHKIGALSRVLATTDADAALIFVRTRATAEELSLELTARGIHAAALSGDVAQTDREKLVNRLRSGFLDVLVATDVAARGLDVERIGLVVNYDVPREAETYVHRIGRTGRAGRHGCALTFVTPKEKSRLRKIEKITHAKPKEIQLPTSAQVSAHRARKLLREAGERAEKGHLAIYETVLKEHFTEVESRGGKFSLETLTYALMALGARDSGTQEEDGPDILTGTFDSGPKDGKHGGKRRKTRGGAEPTFAGRGTMYRVEVGHRDGISPGSIVGAITAESKIRGSQLGRIDIFPSFSLVEFQEELDEKTLHKISRAHVSGRALRISKDRGPGKRKTNFGEAEIRKHRADTKFGEERRKARAAGKENRRKKARLNARKTGKKKHR